MVDRVNVACVLKTPVYCDQRHKRHRGEGSYSHDPLVTLANTACISFVGGKHTNSTATQVQATPGNSKHTPHIHHTYKQTWTTHLLWQHSAHLLCGRLKLGVHQHKPQRSAVVRAATKRQRHQLQGVTAPGERVGGWVGGGECVGRGDTGHKYATNLFVL